ncbi:4-hydroxybenzoate polyprenyltransferase [Kitasatospora sp. MAP12-15]|uniref:UbiA family prenyltransferase n=1 Tax=unclassified Kitasatospora TaxID=2633591 RepID=UPI0024751BD2|nr:UbiA family prenyltransferase [Kitasatospora sp. MAP12-44]MDH6113687.1 4-hydroxybenzoate polyprenyltransferase [Kitasatospora sp. MAP12-44]
MLRSIARYTRLCLAEARPTVQLAFFFRYSAGSALTLLRHMPDLQRVATGELGWFCSTVAIYAFNGVTDRAEDRKNGSTRPIATGRLPVAAALALIACFAAVGTACAWSLGQRQGLLSTGFLAIGYAYSGRPFPLKQTFYTCTGAGLGLGLLTYMAGGDAAGARAGTGLLLLGGAMSVWMGGVGGIAKEFSDIDGDRLVGRRTWPIVLGEYRARRLLAIVAIGTGLAFVLIAACYDTVLLGCALTVLLGALVVSATGLDRSAPTGRRGGRRPYHAFMWTQHLAHLALAGTVFLLIAG